jgi:hypothetical protein
MAEKTLLFRDEKLIAKEIAFTTALMPKVQAVADELVNLGVSFTISTITELINQLAHSQQKETIENYIADLKVNAIENPKIGDISISKSKLRQIIEIPDCNALYLAASELKRSSYFSYIGQENRYYASYYTIVENVVTKLANLDTIITERNSYYSDKDKQIALYNKALEFANTCNALETYVKENGMYYTGMFKPLEELEIIERKDVFIPSYTYITRNAK